ncbi:hypothetical protein O181_122828 [Austropuccinia psidii MF-1]|uniref:Uncharacterized protein n=1 Tax=Austropuccinia psidii MF-1 TaxID=1389203 RepID=A0A9Q3Q2L2_9BASI|nr:hypothetical protein [Austropuccinia psidii MF-1]
MIHGPRSVGHLGPFWPNPMRSKGAKGARQLGPKPQLGPPEQFLATTSLDPKMTKNLMDTILAINPVGPNFGHGPPWPLAATRSVQSVFSLSSRGFLPFLHTIRTQGCRHGAYMVLYTIMHHFCSAIQW